MNIDGKHYRTIWLNDDGTTVEIIDQTKLPHRFETVTFARRSTTPHRRSNHAGARRAADRGDRGLRRSRSACATIRPTRRSTTPARRSPPRARPPSISAGRSTRCRRRCATSRAKSASPWLTPAPRRSATRTSRPTAESASMGSASSRRMPTRRSGERVNILTHCNAGWLACVDWGTALAPIYRAHDEGIDRSCVGGRDAAAQPGRLAHGVRARRAWRAAYADRRQYRRASDAEEAGRSLHRRHRPHHGDRRRRQQDRHLSQGARRARQQRPVLRGAAVLDHRLEPRRRQHHSHRGARAATR